VTYPEKRVVVIRSAAYKRLVRLLVVLFALYALVMEVLVVRYYLSAGDLFPGGKRFLVLSILYWAAAAAALFGVAVLMLRFVVPAVLSESQLRRIGEGSGA
jgi:hypothetical protein